MSSIWFSVKTQSLDDGTFAATASAVDNSAMRVVRRDVADGFKSRSAAYAWANKRRAEQRLSFA